MKNSVRNNSPLVSIVISCRNEENFIGICLDSIIANDYPNDMLEILIVDGMSEDRTREVVSRYAQKNSFVELLINKDKITPVAMNMGIKRARGDIIILVNAHSILDVNFLKYSIEYCAKTGADAVGGMLNTINEDKTLFAQTIPLAADSIFGSGGRRYRSRTQEGWVKDTLPYCAYPKEVFEKIGLIDEELVRDQDEEFNYRILRKGGKIYYTPQIKSYLHIRPSLKKLWRQHFQYGYFKVMVAQKVGAILTWRQLIPSVFVSSLILTGLLSLLSNYSLWLFLLIVVLYLSANLAFSFSIALKKGLKLLPALLISFATLHFSYGLGYLKGIWDFLVLKQHLRKGIKNIKLTR